MAPKNSENNVIIPHSKVLIIDRDQDRQQEYEKALKASGHTIFKVLTWGEGRSCIANNEIDLVLLSYNLADANAEEVVREIKKISSRIRIIILLSQEDTVDRRHLLQHLPIQGCHEKEEGVEKLFLWIDIVLKSLGKLDMIRTQLGTIKSQIKIIEKNKEGLRYIISAMPETINRLQPLDKFIRGILIQLNAFIETENSFLATIDENNKLIVLVGTGVFDLDEKAFLGSPVVDERMEKIRTVQHTQEPIITEHEVYLPLKGKDTVIGIFHLEKPEQSLKDLEIEMLRLFASQAAITIDNSNLFKLATVDGLTGLYVRRYFLQRFQEVLQFASRYGGQAITLLLFDIDHFKYINDTFGHPEGDKVLSQVSSIIRDSIRTTDVTGRLGGEEFAVLLIDTPLEKAREMAELIRKKVENHVFTIQNNRHPVTISIGVCTFPSYIVDTQIVKDKKLPEIAMHDVRRMLIAADKALYSAKQSGRNRVAVAEPLKPVQD